MWNLPVKTVLHLLPLICTDHAVPWRVPVRSHETVGSRDRDGSVSLDELTHACLLYICEKSRVAAGHVTTNASVWFRAPLRLLPFEQLGTKTDQVLLHQERGVELGNEFQEAEHANKFIIPAWFRSNYHFASKAIQDWVAVVTLSQVWIQINICIRANTHVGPLTAWDWCGHVGFLSTPSAVACWYARIAMKEQKACLRWADIFQFQDRMMRKSPWGVMWTYDILPFYACPLSSPKPALSQVIFIFLNIIFLEECH